MRFPTGIIAPLIAFSTVIAPAPSARETGLVGRPTRVELDLNVPARRLDVMVDGAFRVTYRVAVGMRTYPTPIGSFELRRVTWNPWWIPPDSPWAKDEKVTPPGGKNPMGRVKLDFASPYFLHGSPFPSTIGRVVSHGCVRMFNADAIALASLVLRVGMPALDTAAIDAMAMDTSRTLALDLERLTPIVLRYDVIEWRRDTLWVHPDFYRRGAPTTLRARTVLAAAGVDTSRVKANVLRAIVRRGARASAALPVDSLLVQTLTGSTCCARSPAAVHRGWTGAR